MALKSLAAEFSAEYSEARYNYLRAVATAMGIQSSAAALSAAEQFIQTGEKMIIQAHAQLASSLGQNPAFKRIYHT